MNNNRNTTYLNEMEGEPGMRRQETPLAHQVVAETILATKITGALAEYTDQGTAVEPLPDEKLVEIVFPERDPLCQQGLSAAQQG